MFPGIQPTTFDDPEFKEDSVRELVVAPILARLGTPLVVARGLLEANRLSTPSFASALEIIR